MSDISKSLAARLLAKVLPESKKARALIGTVAVVLLNTVLELNIPPDQILGLLGLTGSYMLSQGVADHGKEKAAIEGWYKTQALEARPREPATAASDPEEDADDDEEEGA